MFDESARGGLKRAFLDLVLVSIATAFIVFNHKPNISPLTQNERTTMTASNQQQQQQQPSDTSVEHGGGRWTRKNNTIIVSEFGQHNGIDPDNNGTIKIYSRVSAETWIAEAKIYDDMIVKLYELSRKIAAACFALPPGPDPWDSNHKVKYFRNIEFKQCLARAAYFRGLHKGLTSHCQAVQSVLTISNGEAVTDEDIRKHRLVLPYYSHEYLMDWYIFGLFEFAGFASYEMAYNYFIASPLKENLDHVEEVLSSSSDDGDSSSSPPATSVVEEEDTVPQTETETETEPESEPEPELTVEARLEEMEVAVNKWTTHFEKKITNADLELHHARQESFGNLSFGICIVFLVVFGFMVMTVPSYHVVDTKIDAKYKLAITNIQLLQRQVDHISEWAMAFKKDQAQENKRLDTFVENLPFSIPGLYPMQMRARDAMTVGCFSCQQLQKLTASLGGDLDSFDECSNYCAVWEDYRLATEDELLCLHDDDDEYNQEEEEGHARLSESYAEFVRKLHGKHNIPGWH